VTKLLKKLKRMLRLMIKRKARLNRRLLMLSKLLIKQRKIRKK